MFDTHAHVNFNAFKDDADEVMKRALDKNVSVINVGSQLSTSRRAVLFAEKYPNAYAVVGMHPDHLHDKRISEHVDEKEDVNYETRVEAFDRSAYYSLAKGNKKVVAIGECGLDYYRLTGEDVEEVKEKQRELLREQIDLANELALPMSIHCRDAYDDLIAELKTRELKRRGVIHCFIGNAEQAEQFLQMGFYLGFTGIITFKNVQKDLLEIIRTMPGDKILSETDCPYLAPEPYRGKRNEPAYVEFIIKKIAGLRGWSFEEAQRITDENAKRLFGQSSRDLV
ncbi:MAG: TatD family hydrolase [Parcubacteria group bacterium]